MAVGSDGVANRFRERPSRWVLRSGVVCVEGNGITFLADRRPDEIEIDGKSSQRDVHPDTIRSPGGLHLHQSSSPLSHS